MIKKRNKKGLSAVVTMLLLVALTLVLVGVVWGVVNTLIEDKIEESESCSLIFDKIKINSEFTCYDYPKLKFSIERGDIEVDKLIVGIFGESDSITIDLSEEVNDLILSANKTIPSKKGGKVYEIDVSEIGVPESIKVAPVINEVTCDIADILSEIDNCF